MLNGSEFWKVESESTNARQSTVVSCYAGLLCYDMPELCELCELCDDKIGVDWKSVQIIPPDIGAYARCLVPGHIYKADSVTQYFCPNRAIGRNLRRQVSWFTNKLYIQSFPTAHRSGPFVCPFPLPFSFTSARQMHGLMHMSWNMSS
jgi:hypothetical protein